MADSKFKAMMNSLSSNSTILRELSPEENQSLKNELVQMFQEILAVCQKHRPEATHSPQWQRPCDEPGGRPACPACQYGGPIFHSMLVPLFQKICK